MLSIMLFLYFNIIFSLIQHFIHVLHQLLYVIFILHFMNVTLFSVALLFFLGCANTHVLIHLSIILHSSLVIQSFHLKIWLEPEMRISEVLLMLRRLISFILWFLARSEHFLWFNFSDIFHIFGSVVFCFDQGLGKDYFTMLCSWLTISKRIILLCTQNPFMWIITMSKLGLEDKLTI